MVSHATWRGRFFADSAPLRNVGIAGHTAYSNVRRVASELRSDAYWDPKRCGSGYGRRNHCPDSGVWNLCRMEARKALSGQHSVINSFTTKDTKEFTSGFLREAFVSFVVNP